MLQGPLANWDRMLPLVTLFYNRTTRSITKTSPYALLFARTANILEDVVVDDCDLENWCDSNDFESWLPGHKERLQNTLETHKDLMTRVYPTINSMRHEAKAKAAERFEATHTIVREPLTKGTAVLVLDERKSSKHDQNWVGPYTICAINPTGSYVLKSDTGDIIRRARSQIKEYHADEDAASPESYVVERVIRHRGRRDNVQYLVKWRGYSNKHNSWLSPGDFNDKRIITDYWNRNNSYSRKQPAAKKRKPDAQSAPQPKRSKPS